MADSRDYDLVLYGATGFTGGLTAEYLAKNAAPEIRWAIAGRSRTRLAAVKARLEAINSACADVGLIEADSRDFASLAIMAKRARVVITTVGPYVDRGIHVVRACVASGADYVDITGEPEFVRDALEQFDQPAREQGLRIVNCCGFDSIPHDLGVRFTVEQLPEDVPLVVEGFVKASGRISSGTMRSAIKAMSRLGEERAPHSHDDAPSAPPTAGEGRRVRALPARPKRARAAGGWAVPMPTIDPSIVRRSARALPRYGPDFAYGHYLCTKRLTRLAGIVAGTGAVVALSQFGPTRSWLLGRNPAGQGPSSEEIARGWFQVIFVGSGGGREVVTRVSGGDPGYGETSKMLAESALCLALDRDRLPDAAGVLTPAVAMGALLQARLERAGMRFEVLEQS